MLQKTNLKIFKLFGQKKVNYVLVGVFAVDHYVKKVGEGFHTLDCDILLESTADNLLKALKILEKLGYKFETNGEPLIGIDKWLAVKIIEHQAIVNAEKENEMPLDIILEAGKIPYKKWEKNRKIFNMGDVKIPVGGLKDLLRAKENSNREKDRVFLKLYKIQLKEMLKKKK